MHAVKTILSVPSDETVTEAEFGLFVYSHMTRDQLSSLLESQGPFVEDNEMLFFIRLLDEKNKNPGEFTMNTFRIMKDEDSANIYLVDNVKPEDAVYPPTTVNAWNSPGLFAQGSYTIESESIFTALPSNQLLRPFDNVPRKALAQEVVGNRIVYGNYVQDYNLLDAT